MSQNVMEVVNTAVGIMGVADWIRTNGKTPVSFQHMNSYIEGYDVYLPSAMDAADYGYVEYLLNHPHKKVRLNFGREVLGR